MDASPVLEYLRKKGVPFIIHRFPYEAGGGTKRSSSILGVSEHDVIKSLVFETSSRSPILVLMHGDCLVNTEALAEQAGLTKIWSCAPQIAESFSGWPVGATNPFILKTAMPIFLEDSALTLPKIYINGGGRGLLIEMKPGDLLEVVQARLVRCAKEKAVLVSKAP